MQTMYPAKVNSPATTLVSAIDDTQTTIEIADASILPPAPNIATIGTGEDAETIKYEALNGNVLENVTRGFQGAAKSWSAGEAVARNFTAYDHDAFRQNVEQNKTDLSEHLADETNPHNVTKSQIGLSAVDNEKQARSSQGIRITVSDTEPPNPSVNDLWVDISG